MKKTAVVLGSILALVLSGCANIFTPTPPVGPTVDSAATGDAQFNTAVAQTLTAQPTISPTAVPVTNTAVLPEASATLPPTDVLPATASSTPFASPTGPSSPVASTPAVSTGTFSAETATSGPVGTNPTATLAVGQVTAIWTLAIREYGTLPPAVPFSHVTLINNANTEAYISLQVTMPDGKFSIIEYPVEGKVKIQAPVGSYLYVAWVGGRKMVGNFRLHNDEDLIITLHRDKVVIK